MRARFLNYGESINVLIYGPCATIHVSQLPDGTWDTSERFQVEWDEMVRELQREGYTAPTDEPHTTFTGPLSAEIVGEFEIYYVHRVAEYARFDLTLLETATLHIAV